MSLDSVHVISVTLFPEVWQSPQPRRLIYHGQMIVLDEDNYQDLLSKLPEFWHTDQDKLLTFRYNINDGGYFCERIKRVYNYATKEWSDTPYVFDAGSKEEVDNLIDIISEFYQNYKLSEIEDINNKILENINDLSYLKMILLNSRDKLLMNSDYIMMPDYPINEEQKQEWIDYRQKLRDITDQESWKNNDYANIEMPVSPSPMKQLPELLAQMETLVPNHFRGFVDDNVLHENVENIILTMSQYMIKSQIIDGISKMSLPLFDLSVGTFDVVKSSENVEVFMSNFENFKSKIDTQLEQIGSSLTVEKIVAEMTQKTIATQDPVIDQEVLDIIDELNQSAE